MAAIATTDSRRNAAAPAPTNTKGEVLAVVAEAVVVAVAVVVEAGVVVTATGVGVTTAGATGAGVTDAAVEVVLVVPPEGVDEAAVVVAAALVLVLVETLQLWEMFFRLAVELVMSIFWLWMHAGQASLSLVVFKYPFCAHWLK